MKNQLFFYPEVKETGERVTIAGVISEDGKTLTVAKSVCDSKDKFDKHKGRAIAIGRAMCTRSLKPKPFVQRGKKISSNEDLLPKKIELNPERNPVDQFVELAKTL